MFVKWSEQIGFILVIKSDKICNPRLCKWFHYQYWI